MSTDIPNQIPEKGAGRKRVILFDKIRYTLRLLSSRERILVFFLILLGIVGFFGTLNAFNARFSFLAPARGGTWREGIIGSPHSLNPLLASSGADRDLISLIYSGLMRPDGKGGLVPDIAEKVDISPDGLSYIFTIKNNAEFHDGKKITADDVIFTVNLAKNPSLKSPVRANWEGVEMEKIDEKNVRFWLEKPYAPFLENATLGIMPSHIWKNIKPEQMTISDFNFSPVGSGPYMIKEVSKESKGIISSYTLVPFRSYALGEPFIKKMIFYFYPSEVELVDAYEAGTIDAISSISSQNIAKIQLARDDGALKTLTLPWTFGVFFNQNEKSLFAEKEVRKALDLAINKNKIINEVLQGYGTVLNSPIPPGIFGAIEDGTDTFNTDEAKILLEKKGWKKNEEGLYQKIEKGKVIKELVFSLSTSNSTELVRAADILKQNWEEFGARVEIKVFEESDLRQNVIRPRDYDSLLFGEIVSRDPDPFAFWHSSQRNDPGLNIAMYTNRAVDKALEEARSTIDPEERKKKYEEFQIELAKDVPAVFLYSPYFLYIVPPQLKGSETEHIMTPAERFANVYNWHFETAYVWKIFQ
ncbi:hypothetical protein A2Z53_00965 [Candidatus Giovannonibacteria bacterium RIFCSPHIGHO2_02_42_15]|uniref:Solute-binding protein family 5 domain-containing protein n=2 Tax=Candidatus Giovannoniibacteriota TaxID=1752738 RepID=A0A1F5VK26_9BACT|nr:MAG: Extracellular solute-binding protein [Candidatus Giovannonibacteria bacterium GW2011_GWF2_42_19]OGF63755.1 MAG: hypothetical protein A2Z53_00965 [Candidatus Giovannonibacteria bacterium RIFCSPHIGHO2_02_42_15]HCW88099.1 hypothetical protein [Candidatus Nomurabacteria bacterium]